MKKGDATVILEVVRNEFREDPYDRVARILKGLGFTTADWNTFCAMSQSTLVQSTIKYNVLNSFINIDKGIEPIKTGRC